MLSRKILFVVGALLAAAPAFGQQLTSPTMRQGAVLMQDDGTPIDALHPLPVDATVTANASIAGFTPNGAVANLAVTTSSANVALPAGTVVAVLNSGSADASIKLSVGAGTAATTDFVLKSGATVGLTVGSNTYINAITASGSTTLSIAGGAGLVSGYGGGGAGGSGGVVTNAGTFAVQNTAAIVAGSNVIGKVSAVDSGGTDATDTTNHALKVSIVSGAGTGGAAYAQGTTTSGQSVNPIGCATVSSAPTNTNAQTNMATCDPSGNLNVNVKSASGVAQGSTTSGQTVSPVGCRTLSTTPTDTTAQTNIPLCNVRGNLVVSPYALPDSLVSGNTSAMTGTTSTQLLAAPGAGLYNYVTEMSCVNSHATVGTFVLVQDGSGGTTLKTVAAAALFGGQEVHFPAPLKQPTANTALYVADGTPGANVVCSATGYKAP